MCERSGHARRHGIPVVLVAAMAGAAVWVGIPERAAADARDISGIWWGGTEPTAGEFVGDPPQLTPAGEEQYQETGALTAEIAAAANDPRDVRKCIAYGTPRIWAQPFPFRILQVEDQVAIAYEHGRNFRVVYMDEPQVVDKMAEKLDESFAGNSVGRWEDDTLVIDTIAIKTVTVLNDMGLPHTADLRVIERLRKTDDDVLEVTATVEDPAYYARPWTVRWTFERQPEQRLMDYVCGYGVFDNRYTTIIDRTVTGRHEAAP